jgi:hypothetical protein
VIWAGREKEGPEVDDPCYEEDGRAGGGRLTGFHLMVDVRFLVERMPAGFAFVGVGEEASEREVLETGLESKGFSVSRCSKSPVNSSGKEGT